MTRINRNGSTEVALANHGPDLVARNVSVGGAVQSPYLPDLDIIRGPAGLQNSLGDNGLGLRDVILAQAEIDKNAIRSPAGRRQTERMRSREKDLRRLLYPCAAKNPFSFATHAGSQVTTGI